MNALTGKLRAFVFGPPNGKKVYQKLKAADVPVTTAECRSCADPCDQDHDDFSSKLDIDMDSDLLGSVKPYRRQVVISTGKSDWAKEVTEAEGTLAAFLNAANSSLGTSKKPKSSSDPPATGLFSHTEAGRLSILNGSHRSFSDDESHETVIVLPDFMVVSGVPRTLAGAEALWRAAVDPSLAFHQYLEQEGWEVHTNLDDLTSEPSLESRASSNTEKEQLIETQLKSLHTEHKALILKNSHVGGHKFAGNCIIYTPRGAGVWYGRVTPHEVESIVRHTIIGGQVLPTILRGGVDLACRGKKSLYDW
ncbi:Sucrase/ferredoxin-like-domain-containing protein [Suillus paluster]|uniref:Sucrase/ferredoxin-like-domain-containing protein n=1 Tax=Suillus paluster TaxID=48578 RepID=UPI001B87DED2|nr:Sucrase/ferredoxin-like-domain-containing protein [Suillus paluster]KAG1753811.1 Sucrase/ferredoxin-like-domain-containing protein [Suillus paluster]